MAEDEKSSVYFIYKNMSYDFIFINNTFKDSELLVKLKAEKKSAEELQMRKHPDWNDNYELCRNKVKTNRLTQRQAVNIPLMKETIKTLLSKIDEPLNVEWQELAGDEDKEILYQEIWDTNQRDNKLELIDVLDKKNVLLYGLSTRMLNITDKGVEVGVLDVYDIAFDPLMKSGDVDTARFVVRKNIFKSIREILADDRYTKEGKEELKVYADAPAGITSSDENRKRWEEKMQRIKDMGVQHKDFPFYAGGDRIVNLTEHYTKIWDAKKEEFERRVMVYADDTVLLSDDSLEELLGIDFWPFVVWSEDPETNDIYPDGVADLVRTPNKVINVWFSQMIENRTLKNFQMHWFLPGQNYTPQTYTPGPGVMLPAPPGDDINKVIKPVEISGLDDTMGAIEALTAIVERGTGATAIEKGTPEGGQQTLGEIQILVGKAMERTIGMAKFYRLANYELCVKWDALMHANSPKVIKLYKTSSSGKVYMKKVFKSDWKSDEGYRPIILSSSEREQETVKSIQKFTFLLQQFPNNSALRTIAQKRMLESVDLTPEELKQVEEAETEVEQVQQATAQPTQPTPQSASTGEEDALLGGIEQSLAQLSA